MWLTLKRRNKTSLVGSRVLVPVLIACLALVILYFLMTPENLVPNRLPKKMTVHEQLTLEQSSSLTFTADYPWVIFPILKGDRIGETVIEGNLLAYQNSPVPLTVTIEIVNLTTYQTRTLRIGQELPCWPYYTIDLFGDWLVLDASCPVPPPTRYEAYAFNLLTDELIILSPTPDTPPEMDNGQEVAIYEDQVVWVASNMGGEQRDVYLRDLTLGITSRITTNEAVRMEFYPDIYGNWIAWQSYASDWSNHLIEAYNVVSTEYITIPIVQVDGVGPHIDGDLIVWDEERDGNDSDIWGFDLTTHQLFPIISDDIDQDESFVANGLITYNERPGPFGTPRHYFVYDLAQSIAFFLFIEPCSGCVGNFKAFENLIYWRSFQASELGPKGILGALPLPERNYLPIIVKS